MFPAPFKIRVTARVIARYVYSRCSWIGVFPSCCVDSLLARKIMLWQIWRELFVVEDSDLVVRRQLDDLLLRQIEQNYHEILPLVLSSRKWLLVHKQRQCVGYICGAKWTVFESFYSIQFFGETVQLFSFWQKLCSTKSDFLVSPTKTAILLVDPFYTTTFTLLDLQLHIFLVIRAIYHTKDLLLTHKISTL